MASIVRDVRLKKWGIPRIVSRGHGYKAFGRAGHGKLLLYIYVHRSRIGAPIEETSDEAVSYVGTRILSRDVLSQEIGSGLTCQCARKIKEVLFVVEDDLCRGCDSNRLMSVNLKRYAKHTGAIIT